MVQGRGALVRAAALVRTRGERFEGFAERYREELSREAARRALERLRGLAEEGPLTLLTATKELSASHVAVLTEVLREGL